MNMWRRLFVSLAVAFGLFAAVAGQAMAQEPPALGWLAAANQRHERVENSPKPSSITKPSSAWDTGTPWCTTTSGMRTWRAATWGGRS